MTARIRNVVIGTPFGVWANDRVEGEPRQLGEFYAGLLGMRIIRDDWIKVATSPDSEPQLAFGDGWSDERPPRWPDPEYPQQMHLDLFARDVVAVGDAALAAGATLLQDTGDVRTYADPFGHPFCVYARDGGDVGDAPAVIGRIVIDCFSPRSLAPFYEALLSMPVRVEDSAERVVIAREDGALPMLAFQHAQFVASRWPDPAYPAQVHLDVFADSRKEASELVERLGGIPLPPQGGSCPVYADPAGHPFCLCAPGE